MTPAFRENLGLGLGVLGTGLAAYGAFAGPGKPKKKTQNVGKISVRNTRIRIKP